MPLFCHRCRDKVLAFYPVLLLLPEREKGRIYYPSLQRRLILPMDLRHTNSPTLLAELLCLLACRDPLPRPPKMSNLKNDLQKTYKDVSGFKNYKTYTMLDPGLLCLVFQKIKIWSKIENLIKNRNFGQKSKCRSKIIILVN